MRKFAFVSILLGASIAANAGNLLINPGFETGDMTGWTTDLNFSNNPVETDWSATNNDSYTGDWSATNIGNLRVSQFFTPTDTADISSVSFALKQPGAVNTAYDLIYSDGSLSEYIIIEADGDWHTYDVTGNLKPGKMLSGIGIYGYDGGRDAITYIDDIQVNAGAVPEPATMAALGLGLLGIVRRRRNR